ncbi:MAG: DUF4861 family protein [Armatimonadota bacterium]|jgi:hypothetical protein
MVRRICAVVCIAALAGTVMAETVTLEVTNTLDRERPAAICVGDASLLGAEVEIGAYVGASSDGQKVAVQVDDLDGNGVADQFVMVLDLPAGETTSVWVDLDRPWDGPDRADVRLSWRYEGYAALDTNLMGFGLYGIYAPLDFAASLQWDLYGKRPEARGLSLEALEEVNYHEDNPVAVDYLLVGNTMGLGGPIIGGGRPLQGENGEYTYRELTNGPVRAGFEVKVTDWATPAGGLYDATIHYFVYAEHDFIDAGFEVVPRTPCEGRFGLGVRRIASPDVFLGDAEGGALAVMGQQPGIVGKTGLAIAFDPERFARWGVLTGEEDSYVVYLNPIERADRSFYRARLVGVWSEGGTATVETLNAHVLDLADRFRTPVEVGK